jgi:hypothetical protein
VIDISAGASRLPDALLADGRDDITRVDIPHEALAVTRERLVSDVLCWGPART